MSVDEMSVDEMSVDEMSVDEMSVDEMSVDEMSLYEMTHSTMPCCHLTYCWLLSFRLSRYLGDIFATFVQNTFYYKNICRNGSNYVAFLMERLIFT
jgi:hypothetical protein